MASEVPDTAFDFYIISEDTEWEKQVLQDLQQIKPDIKCLSRKDEQPGKFKLDNLIDPVKRCKKVVVGFTSQPLTGNLQFVAATAVQQMLNRNTLDQGKLIPVRITENAAIPDYLEALTAANGWEDGFYDKLLNTLQGRCSSSSHSQPPSQDDVIRTYLLNRQHELCCNYNRFTPTTMNSRYEVDIAHMFTDLDLLKENKKKQDGKPTTLHDVLDIIKSTPACKVLIDGEGGIGKTTLLRHLSYNWATKESNNTFKGKIVFLINVRDIEKGEDILDAIVKQIELTDFNLVTYLAADCTLIKRFLMNHDDEIVLLLDGLDELRFQNKSPISLFRRTKLKKSTVILTSRSEKIDEFIKECNVHVKVKGFNKENIRKYIGKYFEYFESPELGDSLIGELQLNDEYGFYMNNKHPEVYSMCRNPMLLLSVCIMWEEDQHLPVNKADLFKEIFRCILNQFNKQEANDTKIDIFQDTPEQYVNAMLLLGKSMYYGLKENRLSINKKDLKAKEDIVNMALKLGFVYNDASNLKSKFKECFTAPHKLIVEALVGFYLYKLCGGLGNECTENMVDILMPLDDNEWEVIREHGYLRMAREFAIGFLGADAGKFLRHWITNHFPTYRSLCTHLKLVKDEHVAAVKAALINHMDMTDTCLEIKPHIDDISDSLKSFVRHNIPDVQINEDEHFIHLLSTVHETFSVAPFYDNLIDSICKLMSGEKGKLFAHILVAVPHHQPALCAFQKECTDDDLKCLIAECEKCNIKYDIDIYNLECTTTTPFLVHILTNSPKLRTLVAMPNCITGTVFNHTMTECYSRGIKWQLISLSISDNNISNIDATSLTYMTSKLSFLSLRNCSLSGAVTDDMIRECSSKGVQLELTSFDVSGNNLSNIDGNSLASLMMMSPRLRYLYMSNCSLSNVVMNDMIRKCSSKGVQLQLDALDINDNNFSNIDGKSLASLMVMTPRLHILRMNSCSLSGVVMNDMIKECFSKGVQLELRSLNVSNNYLSNINGTTLCSLITIAPRLDELFMRNCNLPSDVIVEITRECSIRGVRLEL